MCTYTEHLMHEISDFMQGFKVVYFHHIVIVSDICYHNMVKKILYTYVYHIVYYLRKCEALHEITDFVHEMLSVCAPLQSQ